MLLRLGYNALGRGERAAAKSLLAKGREMGLHHGGTRLAAQVLRALGWLAYEEGDHEAGVAMLRESVDTSARIGFLWWQAGALSDLARVYLELGSMEEADAAAREILELARRMNDRAHAVEALAMLASVASARGEAHGAGWLWGAIEAQEGRGPIGMVSPSVSLWSGWETERDRYLTHVEGVRGREFDRGLQDGRAVKLDEAIGVALRDPESEGR
jgi:tetratricopeptide (TPR) repeat protein